MKRSTVYIAMGIMGALLISSYAYSKGSAKIGKKVFKFKKCVTCHKVKESQKKETSKAPYLPEAMKQRSEKWLREYLRDPSAELQKNKTFKRMYANKYAGKHMDKPDLTNQEIEHLIAYLKSLAK